MLWEAQAGSEVENHVRVWVQWDGLVPPVYSHIVSWVLELALAVVLDRHLVLFGHLPLLLPAPSLACHSQQDADIGS